MKESPILINLLRMQQPLYYEERQAFLQQQKRHSLPVKHKCIRGQGIDPLALVPLNHHSMEKSWRSLGLHLQPSTFTADALPSSYGTSVYVWIMSGTIFLQRSALHIRNPFVSTKELEFSVLFINSV